MTRGGRAMEGSNLTLDVIKADLKQRTAAIPGEAWQRFPTNRWLIVGEYLTSPLLPID